jgi:hypothetical protein
VGEQTGDEDAVVPEFEAVGERLAELSIPCHHPGFEIPRALCQT